MVATPRTPASSAATALSARAAAPTRRSSATATTARRGSFERRRTGPTPAGTSSAAPPTGGPSAASSSGPTRRSACPCGAPARATTASGSGSTYTPTHSTRTSLGWRGRRRPASSPPRCPCSGSGCWRPSSSTSAAGRSLGGSCARCRGSRSWSKGASFEGTVPVKHGFVPMPQPLNIYPLTC